MFDWLHHLPILSKFALGFGLAILLPVFMKRVGLPPVLGFLAVGAVLGPSLTGILDPEGAGIVMLWDTGTWTPEVDDVDKALEKGDLKLTLNGFKLKGSWALIRTRGYGGQRSDGRSWLLIKHRDEWSGDLDITTFAPKSVKSDLDFPEILAAENPAIWETNRPVSGGETGAMLKDIIEQAAAIKAGRTVAPATKKPARQATARKASPRKSTKRKP